MPTLIDQEMRLEDRFVAAFERHAGQSLNGANARLHGVRQAAIERFAALGFPARKAEAWKYTPIGKILERGYRLHLGPDATRLTRSDVAPHRIPGLDAHVAVLVNGRFREDLSHLGALPEGVVVTGFARAGQTHAGLVDAHFARYADAENEVFTALNTAFTQDGVFVYVPKNTVVEKPVHVLSLVAAGDDLLLQPRHLVVVKEGAQLRLIETSETLTQTQTLENVVTEVFVGAHAHADLYEIQDEHAHGSVVANVQAYQQAGSVFRASTFTLSGEMIRNNLNVLPDAEGCESHLYGLFLGSGATHVDNHTLVDHARPNCFSNELYKGVLADTSTGVFNGRVLVRQDAQQINAYQSNKSILLSDTAHMYAKPELEIYADDVKCSHGATTGQLDRDAIFYLRSRGLSAQQARALLLLAFARDVLETIRIEPLREKLDALIAARFD